MIHVATGFNLWRLWLIPIATAFRHGLKSVAEGIKPPMGVILPGVRIFRPRATIHQRCEQT
ncbi:hypothetical protein [[Phormidium] sp. ETS-05]|uniref:hypothetical protein n=1 Tax=[Phormidium] sp. ETS-05 TaxID=222819 RepID=UPI0018EF133C|nr:hypothetical protein [[Phormidium] sp. ETS-05]